MRRIIVAPMELCGGFGRRRRFCWQVLTPRAGKAAPARPFQIVRQLAAGVCSFAIALAVALAPVAHAQEQGVLLVAKPALADPNFARTVVLVAQAESGASLGVILNRPADRSLAQVMDDDPRFARFNEPLFLGGPMERIGLFAVFRAPAPPGPALRVAGDLWLALMPETVERLLLDPPQQLRFYLGYAGWAPGQLASEIERGGWWAMEPDPDVAFRSDSKRLWDELSARASAVRTRLQEGPPAMPASGAMSRGDDAKRDVDRTKSHPKRPGLGSSAAAEAGEAPGRALEGQMVVLHGIRNAEVEAHDIEKRRRWQSYALLAVPSPHVEPRLIRPGGERLLERRVFENAFRRDQSVDDAAALSQELDAHARGDDPPRDIDDMNRDSGHGISSASRRTP